MQELGNDLNAMSLEEAARATSFAMVRQVEETRRAFAIYHSSQPRTSSIDFARHLIETFESRNDSLVK